MSSQTTTQKKLRIFRLCLVFLSLLCTCACSKTDKSDWFAFQPKNLVDPGEIGLQDWLPNEIAPVYINGSRLVQGDKAMKVWGTNVEYAETAPEFNEAESRAVFFAKYGVNSVRLHKLTNPGWEGLGSLEGAAKYAPEKLDRFDYFTYQLKKQGINYGFSPIWDLMVFPSDSDSLLAYEEIARANPEKPTKKGLVWFAEDVQDLHISAIVNLLNHKNAHSGLRYADDPALLYVEIQNEESALFYTFIDTVKRYPSYHTLLAERFSTWLSQKYQSADGLQEAWGEKALNYFSEDDGAFPEEALHRHNIVPIGNPWLYDNYGKSGPLAKRLQDTIAFLAMCQDTYFSRVEKAIKQTGFDGPLVAGNWQAGSTSAHFLNLLSDVRFDIVDRHNYQGGGLGEDGWTMQDGDPFSNATMLPDPGSGLLSAGMQQVAGKPFMLSEWASVLPSEYAAADLAIIAAYGLGLQGWDASYNFASNANGFTYALNDRPKKFNNLVPQGIGMFPVLSRMVLRGDIDEAAPIAIRRLTRAQALEQSYDFSNEVSMRHDIKSFSGSPHYAALAKGQVLIDFVNEPIPSFFDNEELKTIENQALDSSTGQLHWERGRRAHSGFVTINSEGTQGVLGFAEGKSIALGDMKIHMQSDYGVVLATARAPQATLSTAQAVIICALARVHNTDMDLGDDKIKKVGVGPMLLEPVRATLEFKRKGGVITVLDHDGLATSRQYILEEGRFELDTQRDGAIYYLLEFPPPRALKAGL